MAIVNRIKRLFHADVHALLDALEEPEAVLRQAIREMEEALDLKRLQLARSEKSQQLLKDAAARLDRELEKIQKDLDLCMKKGSEELARKTIGRKLACLKQLEKLRQRIEVEADRGRRLQQEVSLQQGQLESIVEKARLFVPRTAEDSPYSVAESILCQSEREPSLPGHFQVSDDEIELEWIRLRDSSRSGGKS